MTHRALGLWEIRAASNPKFSLQKEKANTSGKKQIGNVRERKLEAAILQEANGGPQVALEQPTCCKGWGNVQKSPHANTIPARGLADSPHVVWLHPGKPLGPARDRREGCSPVAGSSWKRTHVYVSAARNQSMGPESLIYIQWLIINGLPRKKGHAQAASPLPRGAKPIPPCLLVMGTPQPLPSGGLCTSSGTWRQNLSRRGRMQGSFWGTKLCLPALSSAALSGRRTCDALI